MLRNAKKVFHIISILLLAGAMANLVYYYFHGSLLWKGITSSWFVVHGIVCLIYAGVSGCKPDRYLLCMVLGLFFGMCADVLLGIWFLVGVVVFALGHVMYLVAICLLEKLRRQDLWFVLPFIVISEYMVLFSPFLQLEDPAMKIMLVGYGLVISCMVGKAISNYFARRSLSRLLVLIGAVMFWFSDLVLAVDMFGAGFPLDDILCGFTYWPGQSILAYSLFHYVSARLCTGHHQKG